MTRKKKIFKADGHGIGKSQEMQENSIRSASGILLTPMGHHQQASNLHLYPCKQARTQIHEEDPLIGSK